MTLGLTRAETAILNRLNTPEKIQSFVTAIPINHEPEGDTLLSVREVLRQRRAHCIEGAFVAAAAFYLAGEPPLLLDMQGPGDADHVVALFRRDGHWGGLFPRVTISGCVGVTRYIAACANWPCRISMSM